MLDIFAPRPAGDVLSRSCRITLGDREFTLSVLYIAGNERWRALLEERAGAFVDGLAESKGTSQILDILESQTDVLLELLYAYDTNMGTRPGVLPPRDELVEFVFEGDLLTAIREVWRAANPLVVMRAGQVLEIPTDNSSPPSSTSPTPTAGRPKRSAKH